jgi:N-acetylneuraminic acid mutarotase
MSWLSVPACYNFRMKAPLSFGLGLVRPENMAAKRVTFLLLLLSGALALVQPCRAASIGFETTGSLANARYGHTATLLPNGKVLAVGGYAPGQGYLASAELYDPASGTWTATGSLTNSRVGHTATLLTNGKVLVVGGSRSLLSGAITTELYDPASGTWTTIATFSQVTGHTATLLPDGKVLVVGGFSSGLGSSCGASNSLASLYDPTSDTWTETGRLTIGRSSHTATLLPNGKVLVAGGGQYGPDCSHSILSTAELYDPATGTWTATGSLASARTAHEAVLLPSGQVLVAAGGLISSDGSTLSALLSAELYNPESGTWTSTGSLTVARIGQTMTLLSDGKVLVAGGVSRSSSGSTRASAELYHPASGTWIATGSLTTGRYSHVAALLPNNNVLIAGGYNGTSSFASSELYGKPIPTLLNISTRLRVQTGDRAMIGGFIIAGTEPKTVIIRGIGPSLGMPGALADPAVEVHGASGELLATNDNWREDPNQ